MLNRLFGIDGIIFFNFEVFQFSNIIFETNLYIFCIFLDGINKSCIFNWSNFFHNILSDWRNASLSLRLLNLLHHLTWSHTQNVGILFPWSKNGQQNSKFLSNKILSFNWIIKSLSVLLNFFFMLSILILN